MRNHLLKMAVAAAILPFTLAGCATFHQAHVDQTQAEQSIASYQPPKQPAVVSMVNTPYLMGSVVGVRHRVPAVLKQSITLVSSNPLTIREIGARISQLTGVPVHIDNLMSQKSATGAPGMLPPLPSTSASVPSFGGASNGASGYAMTGISLNWNGSVAGLLRYITAKDGLWWKYYGGAVHIFYTETRTFSIPALSWVTDSSGSIIAAAGANSSGGSSSTGGATTGMSAINGGSAGISGSSQSDTSTGTTDIENTSKVNVWGNLEKAAQTVAGGSARVFADSSTGTLTVTGTPPQVDRVRQWVHSLTRQLSRQVIISVQVYNVQINNEQNYGLNLSGIFNSLGKQYGVSLQGVAPPAPTGNVSPMSLGASVLSTANGALSQTSGSQVAVQALSTLGNVTQVFSRSAMSMNGQPAPIQVAQQTSYLAENSTTSTANVGATSGLVPGTVTTGFTAMFLPRIDNGRVLLGMNMTISNLVSLDTISSGGNSIQVPTVDSSTFQQSVSLKPGQTLLLTGFSQSGSNVTHNGVGSPYMPLLGGGGDASTSKQMIAIVITARIL
ncbi:PilN family type IVB pilus formation outer membrane protein [Acidithiobacillus thiooxidans]|uniref:Type IVB pilus formation outer membrane protein, R64 PilN family n=1 Tax=Acidithiobacillus thiooxidans TaxID=930 RepID=A0A1C2J405_ACITH|nr:PilN family type IVB pilus formation outer membrane protein [Acidithiobacillus thiooxidans]OCX70585.1 type IVB pilus formation outer membrane protein, R64 PilN family [Acidithiobacillus thiooxidans]OCX82976.1 type IVB pilus formation outer membrane protein, R64 PilN family [Acidithiobacillus thiooxidans]